jgi:Na+-driven multidrug efflux pump
VEERVANPLSLEAGAVPTLRTLLKFTLPTLGIWLASPIMSLVDTSVVGRKSAVELAALGPATNMCDTLLYIFYFLAVVSAA